MYHKAPQPPFIVNASGGDCFGTAALYAMARSVLIMELGVDPSMSCRLNGTDNSSSFGELGFPFSLYFRLPFLESIGLLAGRHC